LLLRGDDLINKSCSRSTGPKFEGPIAGGWVFGKGAASSLTTSYGCKHCKLPSGSEAELQSKLNLMHFSVKI